MLDWLDTDTPKNPAHSGAENLGPSSGEVRGNPFFPVSQFRETPKKPNWGAQAIDSEGLPSFPVFPVQKQGVAGRKQGKTHTQGDEKARPIPQGLPALLEAVADFLTASERDHLRAMSTTDPDTVADTCQLILIAPKFPSPEDVAELDRRILKLCDLEPWLAGYLPELQAARRRMAPADVAMNLVQFAEWIREAEQRPAAGLGRGKGHPCAKNGEGC